jgi:hypothetical protein
MKPTRPNAEEFARSLLWQMAGLRADVYETMLHAITIRAWLSHEPAVKIQKQYRKRTLTMQRRIYRESLKRARIRDAGSK